MYEEWVKANISNINNRRIKVALSIIANVKHVHKF